MSSSKSLSSSGTESETKRMTDCEKLATILSLEPAKSKVPGGGSRAAATSKMEFFVIILLQQP